MDTTAVWRALLGLVIVAHSAVDSYVFQRSLCFDHRQDGKVLSVSTCAVTFCHRGHVEAVYLEPQVTGNQVECVAQPMWRDHELCVTENRSYPSGYVVEYDPNVKRVEVCVGGGRDKIEIFTGHESNRDNSVETGWWK